VPKGKDQKVKSNFGTDRQWPRNPCAKAWGFFVVTSRTISEALEMFFKPAPPHGSSPSDTFSSIAAKGQPHDALAVRGGEHHHRWHCCSTALAMVM
jgi:hypothetical protein